MFWKTVLLCCSFFCKLIFWNWNFFSYFQIYFLFYNFYSTESIFSSIVLLLQSHWLHCNCFENVDCFKCIDCFERRKKEPQKYNHRNKKIIVEKIKIEIYINIQWLIKSRTWFRIEIKKLLLIKLRILTQLRFLIEIEI